MREILPMLVRDSNEPMYLQLYKYIRTEIEQGQIPPGEKLPSLRTLSAKMGISITTIRLAYDQLSMEGYVLNREKSGYYVNSLDFIEEALSFDGPKPQTQETKSPKRAEIYDEECFDFIKWKKCLSHVLTYQSQFLLADTDLQGELELREQIAKYVFQARGVHCDADEIVIGAGTQQLLNILSDILLQDGKGYIGFENPGYTLGQKIFKDRNFAVCHLSLDAEGIVLSEAPSLMDLLYVSPSHQFPTGIVMSARRRTQLLTWARERAGYIIEDDYDSELRYFGHPIPSLKAMDKSRRVIYMGSFSSTLLPSIRISYLVLPRELLTIYRELKNSYSQGVSKVDQLTLCKFMQDGGYQKQIRRIRRRYSDKASRLSEFLKSRYGKKIEVVSNTSGLFMILSFESRMGESEIAEMFLRQGLKATPFGSYMYQERRHTGPRVLLYFYNIELKHLMEIMQEVCDDIVR